MNRQLRRAQERMQQNNRRVQQTQQVHSPEVATVKAWDIPAYRQQVATQFGCERKFAFVTFGGIGDVLCTEPTIRYVCEVLREPLKLESITVVTRFPELFAHLNVETIQIDGTGKMDIENGREKYHWFYCGHPEGNLQHSFFTHNEMLPVDYPALSSLRKQLPLAYRTIWCQPAGTGFIPEENYVYVHPGNHWESKRFPKEWWDGVLNELAYRGLVPVLIGGPPSNDDEKPGTVPVNASGCLDLRGKLSIAESAEHLFKAKILITNDSFPLHLATIGHAHIGFFGTAKDPEWLFHYRKTPDNGIQFGWRMENLAKGGAYQRSYGPDTKPNHLSKATPEELAAWLPTPKEVANWAASR